MAKRRSNKPYVMTINEKGKTVFLEYDTYRELVKNLKQVLKDYLSFRHRSHDRYVAGAIANRDYVTVCRSRRGEWGEWFEHWKLDDEKLSIIKYGWM
jgi:hypothetical protein